ncbi:MAG: TVP38/TMEM64 family protein [Mogibacterium sp.]|nr:TVP38/TMEM64 family protein [Mogibacterium sp.]
MNNEASSDKYKKILALSKLILLVIIVAGIPAFLYLKYGAELFSKDSAERVVDYLKANSSIAALLIICIQIVQVVICFLPGQPVQFAASYMFGVARGFAFSITGAVIGTVISFYLAKLLGNDAMNLFFGEEKVRDYKKKLDSGRGLLLAFLIYLIPGIPKDIVSYVAGISDMRFRPFLLVATVGRIPGMLGSLMLGHFFGRQDYRAMIIIAVIIAVILLICYIKRDALIGFLDDVEKKDMESGGKI